LLTSFDPIRPVPPMITTFMIVFSFPPAHPQEAAALSEMREKGNLLAKPSAFLCAEFARIRAAAGW